MNWKLLPESRFNLSFPSRCDDVIRRGPIPIAALALAIASSSGCKHEVQGTDLVRTRSLYADLEARTQGGETLVSARLLLGSANGDVYDDFEDGDELSAVANGDTQRMSDGEDGFTASFDAVEDGDDIVVRFTRTADEDAPTNRVFQADSFEIDLEGGTEVRRGELTIGWQPAQRIGAMTWTARGDCIEDSGGTMSNAGSYAVSEAEMQPVTDGQSCEVELTVSRTRTGDVDPAFESGGRFLAVRTETVRFTSLPSWAELGIEPPEGEPDAGPGVTDAGANNEDDAGPDVIDAGSSPSDAGNPEPNTDAGSADAGASSDAGHADAG